MRRRLRADDAFQQALEGRTDSDAPSDFDSLVKLVSAMSPTSLPQPSPRFRARLRSELLAAASREEDAFAALLEGAPEPVRPELAPLVRVAHSLTASAPAPVEPAPAFRFQLRQTLVAMAAPRRSVGARTADWGTSLNQRMRRSLRTVMAAGLSAAMLAGSGAAVAASSSSLPGDALYGVKRARESAQLTVSRGADRGFKLLGLARVRLQEVSELADRGSTQQDLYTAPLGDMDDVTIEGVSILVTAVRHGAPIATLEKVTHFARAQAQDLSALIERIPPGARPSARDSLALAERVAERAQAVLDGCPCAADPLPDRTLGTPAADGGIGCDCSIEPSRPASNSPSTEPSGDTEPTQKPPPTRPASPPDDSGLLPEVPGTSADDDANDLIDNLFDDLGIGSPTPLPSVLPSVLPTLLPSTPLPVLPI
ncbi:MAG: DUF5667 domain-containing protein [Actinomycetota bacterium]